MRCKCGQAAVAKLPVAVVKNMVCNDCAIEYWTACVKAGALRVRTYPSALSQIPVVVRLEIIEELKGQTVKGLRARRATTRES